MSFVRAAVAKTHGLGPMNRESCRVPFRFGSVWRLVFARLSQKTTRTGVEGLLRAATARTYLLARLLPAKKGDVFTHTVQQQEKLCECNKVRTDFVSADSADSLVGRRF